MNKRFSTLILIIGLFAITGCKYNEKKINKHKPVRVTWEVISNISKDEPASKQILTIKNTSSGVLSSQNWALFYNQTPREVLSVSEYSPAVLERLNGDWYTVRIKPDNTLNPGEEIQIEYFVSHWHIKETDSPKGLYCVFYNEDGREERIVPIGEPNIIPFQRKEQVARHKSDKLPLYTPELQFRLNERLVKSTEAPALPIIPQPVNIRQINGKSTINNNLIIVAPKELSNEADFLAKKLQELTGTQFTITENSQNERSIFLSINDGYKNKETYSLSIKDDVIKISGGASPGVFYGIQSLLNYIPLANYKNKSAEIMLNNLEVNDTPRFGYRGMHLDVSRNFQSKETVLKVLDLMAYYKLNALHFYLTEDEGWRLEIEELPELTKVGARRGHSSDERNSLQPAYGSGPFADANTSYGTGYYSRDDFIEILKYARDRHIQIIPSINFPGHARAAVISMEARYHKYMEEGNPEAASEFRLVHPDDKSEYQSVQYYSDNVVDVGLESTYHFFETVVDDVIEMYAEAGVHLDMIHTGGDEVPNGVWTNSPACQRLMDHLPEIKDPKNLQQYFFKRIAEILTNKGLHIGGWEEVALTKTGSGNYQVNPEFVNKNVVPYVWNNLGSAFDLTHRMANAGYPVIYCGVTNLYFDMAYNNVGSEPGYYWGGFVNERTVWELSPMNMFKSTTHDALGNRIENVVELDKMVGLTTDGEKNIIGLQAELWSETVKGQQMLEYYILPKLISFSERAWANEPEWERLNEDKLRLQKMDQDWNTFVNSLARKELPKLNYVGGGYNYRVPTPGAIIENGLLYINHEYPGMKLYFTIDGAEPTLNSKVYTEPIKVSNTAAIKAIDSEGKGSQTISVKP